MAQRLFEIDDETILDQVQAILDSAVSEDWYDSLTDNERQEVAEADEDIAKGRISAHSKVMNRLKKWTKK